MILQLFLPICIEYLLQIRRNLQTETQRLSRPPVWRLRSHLIQITCGSHYTKVASNCVCLYIQNRKGMTFGNIYMDSISWDYNVSPTSTFK